MYITFDFKCKSQVSYIYKHHRYYAPHSIILDTESELTFIIQISHFVMCVFEAEEIYIDGLDEFIEGMMEIASLHGADHCQRCAGIHNEIYEGLCELSKKAVCVKGVDWTHVRSKSPWMDRADAFKLRAACNERSQEERLPRQDGLLARFWNMFAWSKK